MKNNFISPKNLPSISQFLKRQEVTMNSLVGNLKINDVKDNTVLLEAIQRIKKSVLLNPVDIGEPQFVDYELDESLSKQKKNFRRENSNNHLIHQIYIPFTGNKELFSYTPEQDLTLLQTDQVVIIPYSNNLIVYVDLQEFNPTLAILEATKLLNLTTQFVESNNKLLDDWNLSIAQRIDEKIKSKREQLLKQYSDKLPIINQSSTNYNKKFG